MRKKERERRRRFPRRARMTAPNQQTKSGWLYAVRSVGLNFIRKCDKDPPSVGVSARRAAREKTAPPKLVSSHFTISVSLSLRTAGALLCDKSEKVAQREAFFD